MSRKRLRENANFWDKILKQFWLIKTSIHLHHLYSYLLFHNNNNKLAHEAQKKARRDAMPQRYKGECYEVRDELISQKSKSFV